MGGHESRPPDGSANQLGRARLGGRVPGTAADATSRAVERINEGGAEQADRYDDDHCDEGNHNAVFDGGGAGLVTTAAGCDVGEVNKHFKLLSELGIWAGPIPAP